MEYKYKPGDKFILEITEQHQESYLSGIPQPSYLVKGFDGPFSENVLDKLERIEPPMAAAPKTNVDRIHNMSLDDLAAVIMCPYDTAGEDKELMPCVQEGEDPEFTKKCYECSKAWLQKEADHGQT